MEFTIHNSLFTAHKTKHLPNPATLIIEVPPEIFLRMSKKSCTFATAFEKAGLSNGVMAALQILVLSV